MKREEYIRLIAGSLIMLSIVLGNISSPVWDYLAGFVAVNLIQSPFTGFCGLKIILEKLKIGNEE